MNEGRSPTGDGGGGGTSSDGVGGKATAIEGYAQEEQPALLREFQSAWVPQHPRPRPAAQPPPRPPTPPKRNHRDPSYNIENFRSESYDPPCT